MKEKEAPGAFVHFHRRTTDRSLDGNPEDTGTYIHMRQRDRGDGHEQDEGGNDKEEGSDKESDKKDGKEGDEEDGEKKKMSPRKKRLLIIAAIIIGLVLIIVGVLFYLHARHFENTDDAFIDGHVSQVSARVSGQIQTLLVRDNEHVKAGELLTEIDPRDYQVRLLQAQAQLKQAQAQAVLQEANIGQAEANVEVAQAQVFQADRDLARFRAVDPKAITRQQLDNAIAASKSANARLEASRQAVEAAKAQEGAALASAAQADADVKNAELQLSYTKIVSPIEGRVTRRTVEVGNVVSAGQPLLAIASNDLWVTANFKETQLTYIRVGQPVSIHVDAYPQQNFSGHVDSFQKGTGAVFSSLPAENATGNYVKVVQRVPVKIVFDDARQRDKYPLSPGMSVEPRVKVR